MCLRRHRYLRSEERIGIYCADSVNERSWSDTAALTLADSKVKAQVDELVRHDQPLDAVDGESRLVDRGVKQILAKIKEMRVVTLHRQVSAMAISYCTCDWTHQVSKPFSIVYKATAFRMWSNLVHVKCSGSCWGRTQIHSGSVLTCRCRPGVSAGSSKVQQ